MKSQAARKAYLNLLKAQLNRKREAEYKLHRENTELLLKITRLEVENRMATKLED